MKKKTLMSKIAHVALPETGPGGNPLKKNGIAII